ncbi:MANSC domain-containing protein 1 isoform X1 [Dunckerocampus dactyliophorus]|uniref:MANSC domain-containing protein 1 isoform X1 n=2 Tax=Dunckerocampus dactyliophorus TaxID=161453 RepID=UPI002404BB49|nr:MANSC domain-containing protein 1 isoform X1 [Dunckerocampus dactyliophorus]
MTRALLSMLGLVAFAVVVGAEPDTCFSRQHQGAMVNIRLALNRTGGAMEARVVRSEQDCVLACCSLQVKPGSRCNMAIFNANKSGGEDNCFLLHCPREQDCPLRAQLGVRTYDIYKGVLHAATVRPVAVTTTTAPPPTATAMPTTAAPTTMPSVTSTLTKRLNKTSKKQNKTSRKGKGHVTVHDTTTAAVMVSQEALTMTLTPPTTSSSTTTLPTTGSATSVAPPTTATTTTLAPPTSTSTTSMAPPTTTILTVAPPTTTTSTVAPLTTSTSTVAPPTTSTLTVAPPTTTTLTVAPPTTTTLTVAPPITTALMTVAPPTTPLHTTLAPPTSTSTVSASLDAVIVPHGDVQTDTALQNRGISRGKAAATAGGGLRSGMVAFMVLGIAALMVALAVGGRKAMESFDRRHYTRLELNDLHYDV